MSNKPYLAASREFLTTLIEKGTDRYGKKSTPVFCLSLDPETYTPPKAPEKIDRDYDTFICNRHSQFYSGKSEDLYTFIKHTGLFAHAFALAHAKSGDPKYLEWAKKMSDVFWNIRDPETNLVRHCVQTEWGGPQTASGGGIGELSLFLMRAASGP